MASHSGIRATGSDQEYSRKPILKNAAGYGAWKSKMAAILQGEQCWRLVQGIELEPQSLGVQVMSDGDVVIDPADQADIEFRKERLAEIKNWQKRYDKAASLITQAVDDSLVQMLDVYDQNPILIWAALKEDYNTVTPSQLAQAAHSFLGYVVTEDDTFLQLKHNFDELLRKVVEQGGSISPAQQLQTLLSALPMKYDVLRESYYGMIPPPPISYLWSRLYDIETTQLKRDALAEASGARGEALYQKGGGRGGSSSRARGRGASGRGGGRAGGAGDEKNENCFRCGEVDHWARECPRKDTKCNWCGVVGHIEKTCYSKANGNAKGGRGGGRGGRGAARGGRSGGYLGEGVEVQEEVAEQGHGEAMIGEVNIGRGEEDGDGREWVCDSGADFHMSGDCHVVYNRVVK